MKHVKVEIGLDSKVRWTVDGSSGATLAAATKKKGTYICPLCESVLAQSFGEKMHPGDPKFGITLRCTNLNCPAQEVMGHGDNANDAFEIITHKFKQARVKDTV